jgi:hypothetical protein
MPRAGLELSIQETDSEAIVPCAPQPRNHRRSVRACTFFQNWKLKLSQYTLPRRLGGEEVQLLLILDLGPRWGWVSASRPGRALASGKGSPVPNVQEAGCASQPVWTQRLEQKSFRRRRGCTLDLPVVQPRARHYTNWATRLTSFKTGILKWFR